jgi:hypothetical protein
LCMTGHPASSAVTRPTIVIYQYSSFTAQAALANVTYDYTVWG